MKKTLLLTVLLFFIGLPLTFAYSFQGSGSDINPYQVNNCTDLQNLYSNNDSIFRLMQDINCSETSSWHNNTGWRPIENFAGVLDGDGYTVFDIFCDVNLWSAPGHAGGGLFRRFDTTSALVMDLNIYNINLSCGEACGGVVGSMSNSKIDNVNVTGNLEFHHFDGVAGGLVGWIRNSTITHSSFSGVFNISSTQGLTGGAIGMSYGENDDISYITDVHVNIDMTCDRSCAGFFEVDRFARLYICNSSVYGSINSTDNVSGWGSAAGFALVTSSRILNSFAWVNVTGYYASGFIHQSFSNAMNIRNSFVVGNVHAISGDDPTPFPGSPGGAGGFIGQFSTGTIFNSYSATTVSGDGTPSGGFEFTHYPATYLYDSYYDNMTAPYGTCSILNPYNCSNATGKNTIQMKTPSTFNTWGDDWILTSGYYPYLAWSDNPFPSLGIIWNYPLNNSNMSLYPSDNLTLNFSATTINENCFLYRLPSVYDLLNITSGINLYDYFPVHGSQTLKLECPNANSSLLLFDVCIPSFSCVVFADCINETEICLNVSDSHLCGLNFTGNISSFDRSCTVPGVVGGGFSSTPQALFYIFLFLIWVAFVLSAYFLKGVHGKTIQLLNIAQMSISVVFGSALLQFNAPVGLIIIFSGIGLAFAIGSK